MLLKPSQTFKVVAVKDIKLLESRRIIFSPKQEQELLLHMIMTDVRKVAFQLYKRNKIKHNFKRARVQVFNKVSV